MFKCHETIDFGFDTAPTSARRVRALERQLHDTRRQISRLRADLSRYQYESERDELTGLANRRRFVASLRDAVLATDRKGESFCLMIIDIDHFKRFNDAYGHLMGDTVLQMVARALSDGVRLGDLVARHGGEEFAVVLPDIALKDAIAIAERLRVELAARTVLDRTTGERIANVTCSIGVGRHQAGESCEALVRRCDAALYQAKRSGRDRVEVAEPPAACHGPVPGIQVTAEGFSVSHMQGILGSNGHGLWETTFGTPPSVPVRQDAMLALVEYL